MKSKLFLLAGAAALSLLSVAPAAAADWWENTSISGRMFFDMSNIDQTYHNGAAAGNPNVTGNPRAGASDINGTGFDVKRFYVGIDHKFNDIFSANVTTDFTYDSTAAVTQVFIKKAYMQAKLDPAFVVRVGSADMPWLGYVDGIYGYRYVENTLTDRTKYANSADWGGFVLGDLADGLLSYSLAVVNGNGYKNPTRANQVDVEGRVSLKWNGLNVAVGGYDGERGAVHNGVAISTCSNSSLTTDCHTASRFDALIGYVANGVHAGFEYYSASNWNSVKAAGTDKSDGYSLFAAYDVTPQWALFGRYDWQEPKTKNAAGKIVTGGDVKDKYYNVGVQYTPYKMINLSLVYKHEDASGGNINTSDGYIGGVAGTYGKGQGSYNEIGLFGNLQW